MKKCLKTLTVLAVPANSLVMFTTAIPAGNHAEKPTKMQQAQQTFNQAAADGKVLTRNYKV